jgi:hypothetical protein
MLSIALNPLFLFLYSKFKGVKLTFAIANELAGPEDEG